MNLIQFPQQHIYLSMLGHRYGVFAFLTHGTFTSVNLTPHVVRSRLLFDTLILPGLRGILYFYEPYHEWVYGYKAHVSISVAPTTVRVVLDATVTGSACESHVLQGRIKDLRPTLKTLLLDAGYDDADLIAECAKRGIRVLAPLAKPIGKPTAQDRRDLAAYLASPEGKARYRLRGCSIEPFFATIKDFFSARPRARSR